MNKFDVNSLIRPHLKSLIPYASARDEFSGDAKIFLDANENPLGSTVSGLYNRYPDPLQRNIKEKLSQIKQVNQNQIFIGNGSDEAIDLLIRAFCEPGIHNVLIMPPTYGMYKVSANINNVGIVEVPLTRDYQPDPEAVLASTDDNTRMIFICTPNNPTGNSFDQEKVTKICDGFKGILVIDEAYIDFTNIPGYVSILDKYPNLVVLQTLSKAWGLAALRLGMAYASPEIIGVLNKIKPPYNISKLTQEKVEEALDNEVQKNEFVKEILNQRKTLIEELEDLSTVKKIHPTDANFLLVEVEEPVQLYNQLIEEGVVVRNRSNVQLCEGCLRITVGTEDENQTLIEKLKELR